MGTLVGISTAKCFTLSSSPILSHLEGDALNVALLVPEVKRVTQAGLVGALTEHYGSPGRLPDYRRQFDIGHRSRDTCSESVQGHGRERTTVTYTGPGCRRS